MLRYGYNHPSAMVVVSSGDSDYSVSYPASSPYVTAVGGTNLAVADNGRGWNEVVWNNANIQGTGSGCSSVEPKPFWQKDLSCPTNRTDNDVAAVADPYSGVAFYDTYITSNYGGWQVVGGTSAATPIIASVYALAGAKPASLYYGSASYAHTDALNDVTEGDDGGCGTTISYFCTAEVGYDGPTGNGTPNGLGAFGGPNLSFAASSQASRKRHAWRHVIQVPAGTPLIDACPKPKPGFASCYAILAQ